MITEKEIRTILHKFATELAEYVYHCNYKFSSSKSFEKGKDLIYKKYAKILTDKIEEKNTVRDMIKNPWRYKRNPDTEKAYKDLEERKNNQ